MMEPAVFKVVSGTGEVHGENLTSTAAYAMAEFLLTNRNLPNVRTEPMAGAALSVAAASVPHVVSAVVAEAAVANAIREIKPGTEREALCEAIETHLDTAARLDAANQAVERASAFIAARQSELDAMTAAYQIEIEAAGANLAEALKAGGVPFDANRPINRSAVMTAEERRDMARAALDRITGEQSVANAAYTSAETGVRLAVMAVKRADVAAMVKRLQDVKTEYMALMSAIDGARFSDVPTTQAAREAMCIEPPHAGLIDAAAKLWSRYSAALRDDPEAAREDFA